MMMFPVTLTGKCQQNCALLKRRSLLVDFSGELKKGEMLLREWGWGGRGRVSEPWSTLTNLHLILAEA